MRRPKSAGAPINILKLEYRPLSAKPSKKKCFYCTTGSPFLSFYLYDHQDTTSRYVKMIRSQWYKNYKAVQSSCSLGPPPPFPTTLSIDNQVDGRIRAQSPDRITLPPPKLQNKSRWQQKMSMRLDNNSNNSTGNTVVQNTPNQNATILRYSNLTSSKKSISPLSESKASNRSVHVCSHAAACKPRDQLTGTPRKPDRTFLYPDPVPATLSEISNKNCLSQFEERILQLEKIEKDSIVIEKSSKMRTNKESTSRVPTTLLAKQHVTTNNNSNNNNNGSHSNNSTSNGNNSNNSNTARYTRSNSNTQQQHRGSKTNAITPTRLERRRLSKEVIIQHKQRKSSSNNSSNSVNSNNSNNKVPIIAK